MFAVHLPVSSRTSASNRESPTAKCTVATLRTEEPVEADVGWRISNAVDWQPQRLLVNSSSGTVAPYAEGVGGQSERAYRKPALRRPASASQAGSDGCSV